jgi:hypothetical protein
MTTNDTCPHCGAEIFDKADNYTLFKCASIVWNNGSSFIQRDCLKNQIAAQAAEIERLKADNKYLKVSLHKLELLVEHRRQSRGEIK